MHSSTQAIHHGQAPDTGSGAIIPPVYLSSTYVQEAPDVHKGYDYTRAGNPNFTNLEEALAALEGGNYATVFSSGLGAITALASTLQSGDQVVATQDLYGGTHRLFQQVFSGFGVEFTTVDTQDLDAVAQALEAQPKVIFLESPTNPLLQISDIQAIAELAHAAGTTVVVDNTFATPVFQQPLSLGADIVIHSTTKYIGGHSDVIGGAAIVNDEQLKTSFDFARKAMGLNPSPFDVWLTHRGLKTLPLRMERHDENALTVAQFFEAHPRVKQVYYPGLASHKNHQIAQQQMQGFSGIVSVDFDLSVEETLRLISSFKFFQLAESLGGVESLVDHPARMTHASLSPEERKDLGISDTLVRFSVGIEHVDDLLEDLSTGLEKVS